MLLFNLNMRRVGAYDTIAASLLPLSLLDGHGFVLDNYVGVFPPAMNGSIVRSRQGHAVSFYPVVTPVLVTPLYFPWALARSLGRPMELTKLVPLLEKISATIVAGLSVAVIFLLLDGLLRRRDALLLTLAYAAGTSTWSISSQALWQHGAAELLIALSLLLLRGDRPGRFSMAALGICAGLITANRPVDIVFSAVIAWLVVRRWRFRAVPFFFASALVAALWIGYNTTYFHSVLGGYGDWRTSDGKPLWMATSGLTGFVGLLISNRGLLTFSPFLLFFLLSPRASVKKFPGLGLLLLAVLVLLYVTARTPDWPGGYSYGPRLATDALPVLILALAGPVERMKSVLLQAVFGVALLFGILCQGIGAFCFPGGDSGNEDLGLWNLTNSSPVLAARAGPRSPDFAHLLLRPLAVRDRLPNDGLEASYEWTALPGVWRAGEAHRVRVNIRNGGRARWSSLGGWFGIGAVRVAAYWTGTDGGPPYRSPLLDSWLSLSLAPGSSTAASVLTRAPNVTDRMRLCVELLQLGFGPFSERGVAPLSREIRIQEAAGKTRAERAVEWSGVEGPRELRSGVEALYRVGFRNPSAAAWPRALAVAYHWRRVDGPEVVWDGERTQIPETASKGEALWLDTRVLASVPPGSYELAFDVVEEGVTWFSHEGSPPMVLAIRVGPAGPP